MAIDKIKKEVKEKQKHEVGFDKNGVIVKKQASKDIYGKVIYLDDKESSHHVKVLESNLYDPMGTYSSRRRYLEATFKRVSKNTFDFYMMYLKTNNSIYLTKAQRGFLND
jgi:hypothetical protein|tara:strand:+ start:2971 stop:3300 length:330 start_codon:yes stop_codon:yes gene_type:complete